MVVRAESLECCSVEVIPVVRMGNADEQLGPFLERFSVQIDSTVFCHYPVCVSPRGYHTCTRVKNRDDLGLPLLGPGSECRNGFSAF